MSPAERKQYLQSIGVLPPDVDGQMNPMSAASLGEQARLAPREASPTLGESMGEPTSNPEPDQVDPVNPNDPREKLRQLMTPELMQKLRDRAGNYGGGSPNGAR